MKQVSRRAEVRLRLLNALPQGHIDHVCNEIRQRCRKYVYGIGIKVMDRPSETLELFSEVMTRLLGATSRTGDSDENGSEPALEDEFRALAAGWTIDDNDPARDGRVAWLIAEVGGEVALAHRYEDMRRQRFGRHGGGGYRAVQLSALQARVDGQPVPEDEALARVADGSVQLEADPDEAMQADEMRLAWRGLLACARTQFPPDDDVVTLLAVLAKDDDIAAEFGSEWPVRRIITALNAARPARPWDDHRFENAKKRLKNWILRLKRDHGLDATDLVGFFVRCSRATSAEARP